MVGVLSEKLGYDQALVAHLFWMNMQPDKSSGSSGVELGAVATAVGMRFFCCLVWPFPLYEFVKAKDWVECICKRLQRGRFLDDVMAYWEMVGGNSHISARQWDNVLAQSSLLHINVR